VKTVDALLRIEVEEAGEVTSRNAAKNASRTAVVRGIAPRLVNANASRSRP
jgi:hypothetical protein